MCTVINCRMEILGAVRLFARAGGGLGRLVSAFLMYKFPGLAGR